ncbi:MAG: nucleotidyl transferase AbiEii/AbiGii toxin family protein [Opitutaceae bacterium]|nr:nucleotidyl transferase AbiEii/AbiGii toxin family protein [Opitutaceae bacterium]
MITRAAIEERVREWSLREDVVEKDYVLGWLLWGISIDEQLGKTWVFKGGTCLKKCYFETYRFSEDLDFTILPGGPARAEDMQPALLRLLARVQETSGIQLDERPPLLRTHESGRHTEGRVYYRGPRGAPQVASVKLDLSASEQVVRPPVLRPIGHAFPDELPEPAQVPCYSFEEVFAEKIRAMGERCRPRDLYDIIHLYRRSDLRRQPQLIREVLHEKCRSKGVSVPTMAAMESMPYREEIEIAWENMLAHQLPSLPEFATFWAELAGLFVWLETAQAVAVLPVAPTHEPIEEGWMPPATAHTWGESVPIEAVRFAAANRLCVNLGYKGTVREIEPYALRRSKAGPLLLVAIKRTVRQPRTYRVDRIESISVTRKPFIPVYEIEIGAGELHAPPLMRTRTTAAYGPPYVFECPLCGKLFKRSSYDSKLRPHKDRSGWDCSGRAGCFVGND